MFASILNLAEENIQIVIQARRICPEVNPEFRPKLNTSTTISSDN